MRELVIGLDAVAALGELAGGGDRELAAAATLASLAGADSVEVGVNESLRPVGEVEVHLLRRTAGRLSLRLTPAPSLLKLALETRPDCAVLASGGDGPSGPLDLRAWGSALAPAARTLREAGIRVCARVAPEANAVKAAHAADVTCVDLCVSTVLELPGAERREGFERLADAARLATKLRLAPGLAGGLDLASLPELLAAAPEAQRVVFGRGFARRALLVGVERAVRDLRERLG